MIRYDHEVAQSQVGESPWLRKQLNKRLRLAFAPPATSPCRGKEEPYPPRAIARRIAHFARNPPRRNQGGCRSISDQDRENSAKPKCRITGAKEAGHADDKTRAKKDATNDVVSQGGCAAHYLYSFRSRHRPGLRQHHVQCAFSQRQSVCERV